jgi:glycosyltransferase involved in cell wall biosynthesis
MRIGINALYLIPGGVGGTEIYLRRLLAAMARLETPHEFFVYFNRETGADLVPGGFRAVPQPVKAVVRPWRIAWEQTGLVSAMRRDEIDVVLNPGTTAPLSGPPSVTVFHDLHYIHLPEDLPWFQRPVWNVLMGAAARRSTRILAVSEATRADFLRHYHRDAAHVRAIHHGVEPQFFELGPRAPEPFLLCVSTLHPHKNLDRLVRAFAEFKRKHPEFKLVLTGLRGFFTKELEEEIARSGIANAIELTGWIPREKLYDLFRRATAFVYPSRFEGFGMPVAEAMAAGLPVGCSDIAPLREVAGEHAVYFDPFDESAITAALERVAGDPELRARLTAEGPMWARRFSWDRCAKETLELLVEAARG